MALYDDESGLPTSNKGWEIYAHVHRASGRRYIGQSKNGWKSRWEDHVKLALAGNTGCRHFYAAIRLYGPDSFDHEVLEICDSVESANDSEKSWIAKFGTCDPDKGFNLAIGGYDNPWERPGVDRDALIAKIKASVQTEENRSRAREKMERPRISV